MSYVKACGASDRDDFRNSFSLVPAERNRLGPFHDRVCGESLSLEADAFAVRGHIRDDIRRGGAVREMHDLRIGHGCFAAGQRDLHIDRCRNFDFLSVLVNDLDIEEADKPDACGIPSEGGCDLRYIFFVSSGCSRVFGDLADGKAGAFRDLRVASVCYGNRICTAVGSSDGLCKGGPYDQIIGESVRIENDLVFFGSGLQEFFVCGIDHFSAAFIVYMNDRAAFVFVRYGGAADGYTDLSFRLDLHAGRVFKGNIQRPDGIDHAAGHFLCLLRIAGGVCFGGLLRAILFHRFLSDVADRLQLVFIGNKGYGHGRSRRERSLVRFSVDGDLVVRIFCCDVVKC